MTLFVGARTRVSTELRDLAGALTNGTVTVTITRPDGTVATPAPTNPSVGNYYVDVDCTIPGRWHAAWVSTSGAVTAEPERWYVYPLADTWVISVAEAKAHLNTTAAVDDEELEGFVASASEFVQNVCGAVVRQTRTEVQRVHGGVVWLNHPCLSVTSITEVYGGTRTYDAATVLTQSPELGIGKLWLGTSYGNYPVRVEYVAGRAEIPALIRSAALDYLKWDWLSQRGAGPTPFTAADEFAAQPGTVPYKVRQKLEAYALPGIA